MLETRLSMKGGILHGIHSSRNQQSSKDYLNPILEVQLLPQNQRISKVKEEFIYRRMLKR
jgi:hypothetical protein